MLVVGNLLESEVNTADVLVVSLYLTEYHLLGNLAPGSLPADEEEAVLCSGHVLASLRELHLAPARVLDLRDGGALTTQDPTH